MKPLHSIIIITYNQENLIGRVLDSILCQKEFVHEIIISDDCSTDTTWEVLNQYKNQYPEIIKPFRNPVNLGIFGNMETARTKATGNIIWFSVGGDDAYCDGLFQKANHLIEEKNIDLDSSFTLYFDFKTVDQTGKEKIFRNNLVQNYPPVGLKIRQLIFNRTTGYSRKVLEKFYTVRKDLGIFTDGLVDIQVQMFSEKNYYCRFVGSIYFLNIGISSKTPKDSLLSSNVSSLDQLKIDIKDIKKGDLKWIDYKKTQLRFLFYPTFNNYMHYFCNSFKIFPEFYGFKFILRELKYIIRDFIRLHYLFFLKRRK
jgi:glycosyltransferase involved in cell wall biosynthesis